MSLIIGVQRQIDVVSHGVRVVHRGPIPAPSGIGGVLEVLVRPVMICDVHPAVGIDGDRRELPDIVHTSVDQLRDPIPAGVVGVHQGSVSVVVIRDVHDALGVHGYRWIEPVVLVDGVVHAVPVPHLSTVIRGVHQILIGLVIVRRMREAPGVQGHGGIPASISSMIHGELLPGGDGGVLEDGIIAVDVHYVRIAIAVHGHGR
ncbi:hypothetical protein DSECCO2_621300 [anaerobic digester metagenome]